MSHESQTSLAPGAATLAAAVTAVSRVAHEGRSADAALQEAESRPDRAAVRAIALGTMRWYLRLAPALGSLVTRPAADFELLSAYLDGEVTATERRQVEEWLSTDASVKCLYKRLLNLRQGLQNIPVPPTNQSSETTIEQVLKRVNRPQDLAWMFGGTALAACILGTISSLFPGNSSGILQVAQTTELTPAMTQPATSDSSLMVALNKPVMEIPKTAIAPK